MDCLCEVQKVELIADHGPEQDDLTTVFTSLTPYSSASLDAAEDIMDLPVDHEPEMFRRDLAQITAGSLKTRE